MFDKLVALWHTPLREFPWYTHLLIAIGLAWYAFLLFYTLYLAAVNLWDNRKGIAPWIMWVSAPMLILMITVDTFMNLTVFTIFMLDLPREALVTSRMKRYRAQTRNNWRKAFSNYLCTNVLNPFDPTKHHC